MERCRAVGGVGMEMLRVGVGTRCVYAAQLMHTAAFGIACGCTNPGRPPAVVIRHKHPGTRLLSVVHSAARQLCCKPCSHQHDAPLRARPAGRGGRARRAPQLCGHRLERLQGGHRRREPRGRGWPMSGEPYQNLGAIQAHSACCDGRGASAAGPQPALCNTLHQPPAPPPGLRSPRPGV